VGKFADGLHDFTRPLSAGDDDDDVGLGVAGNDLLEDGFPGAEWPRNAGGPAFGQGEEDVDQSALGQKRPVGDDPLLIGAERHLHGPLLLHGDVHPAALVVFDLRDRVVHRVLAAGADRDDLPRSLEPERNHDMVRKEPLRHAAEKVAGLDDGAGLDAGLRRELPEPLFVEGRQILPSSEKEAGIVFQFGQRVLQAVVDALEQTGAQRCAEQFAGKIYGVAHAQAGSALENLHVDLAIADTDDLRLERHPFADDEGHLVLHDIHRLVNLAGNQRTIDRNDTTLRRTAHVVPPPYKKLSKSKAALIFSQRLKIISLLR